MDGKLTHPTFKLCKKPQETQRIKRVKPFFPNVLKIAIFREIAKVGQMQNFQKSANFQANF